MKEDFNAFKSLFLHVETLQKKDELKQKLQLEQSQVEVTRSEMKEKQWQKKKLATGKMKEDRRDELKQKLQLKLSQVGVSRSEVKEKQWQKKILATSKMKEDTRERRRNKIALAKKNRKKYWPPVR